MNNMLPTSRDSYTNHPRANRYQDFFPASLRMSASSTPREEWWSYDGLDIHLDRLEVENSRLKIIVLHGVGAYGRVMAPASVLAQRHGYETVTPDLPGYGLTQVPRSRMEYDLWVDCVCALIDAEIARDGKPVVLFGVSLGGVLAYHVAAKSKKVIGVATTMLADPHEVDTRRDLARYPVLASAGLWLLDRCAFAMDGLPLPMAHVSRMNRISNLPELTELCSTDPMGGGNWVPARFLRTLMNYSAAMAPEEFRVCPVLLAHPGCDRMTDIAISERFFERLACEKKMVVLEGASHMPTEHPGIDQFEQSVLEFFTGL